MSYNIEVIKKEKHKTSDWSGGTTTELYIYPKGAIYNEHNFKWRLSSAKVEVEQSIFTPLPGISRLIMIIEGELMLEHFGHHNATLKPFEQDSFSGEWTTSSVGKVKDFNLMMDKGCKGKLEHIYFNKGEFKNIVLLEDVNELENFLNFTEAFYVVKGDVKIDTEKEEINLNEGELAIINITEKEITTEFKICNRENVESKVIRATIFYK